MSKLLIGHEYVFLRKWGPSPNAKFPAGTVGVRARVLSHPNKGDGLVVTVREGRRRYNGKLVPCDIFTLFHPNQMVRECTGPAPDYFNQKPMTRGRRGEGRYHGV